jgi:drug/metabolite transporter (DMT)-like permease
VGGCRAGLRHACLGSRIDLQPVCLPARFPDSITTRSILGLVYLVVFGSLVGYTAYTWLLQVAPTSLVSTYAYVNPLVALAIGALLAGEPFSVRTLLAAGIILGSVGLTTTAQPPSKGDPLPVDPVEESKT